MPVIPALKGSREEDTGLNQIGLYAKTLTQNNNIAIAMRFVIKNDLCITLTFSILNAIFL